MYRALALAALMASAAFAAQPNFTGDWKLAVGKSEFGQFPPPSAMSQKVTHEDPSLKVATKMSTDNGDFEFAGNYSTDGKETTNEFGPASMKSTAKWEGEVLVIDTKGRFGDNDLTMKDRWTLSADGKTMTLVRRWSSSMGDVDQKLVFEKQ
jgi:hypothetical protein